MSAATWMSVCRRFVAEQGLDPECLVVLEAFRPPRKIDGPRGRDMHGLELQLRLLGPGLVQRIDDLLDGEVDADQAHMFGRRFAALLRLLTTMAESLPEARVLRAGVTCRMAEILAAPAPRALRVRALVDFYTSRAAALHHRQRLAGREPPTIEECAEAADWRPVAEGLEHAWLQGESDSGPLHVNLLRATDHRLQALDCRRLARVGRDFLQHAQATGAVAAVSGGFFLYSEADIEPPSRRTDPVGLLVRDGQVLSPPVFHRATLAQDSSGHCWIERMGLRAVQLRWRDGKTTRVASCNTLNNLGVQAVAFNRAWGPDSPEHAGHSLAIVGHRVLALQRGSLPIPLAGFVLALPTSEPRRHSLAPGAKLVYELPPGPGGEPPHNAMAGGPLLVEDMRVGMDMRAEDFTGTAPPATFSSDETLDQNLLPRLAVGLDLQDRLVLAAIDGRNFHRAPGFTLEATTRLMQALGCHRAMNLDGGSSKRMVLMGKVLDLPTTELIADEQQDAPVRSVHTAILLHAPVPEEDPAEE